MTTAVTSKAVEFRLCAVCKIDLKGRFVYIDDEMEKLLGLSKEELFGKSLLDHTDSNSRDLVIDLLSHRNHYETFYETTTLDLIASNDRVVRATVIASLNFAGGNPVNFQLIINKTELASGPALASPPDTDWPSFYDSLLADDDVPIWKVMIDTLSSFGAASQVSVYRVEENSLELLSVAGVENPEDMTPDTIPETTALHTTVAESGTEYDPTLQSAVQQAIEITGSAPQEYVARITPGDGSNYLLRLIFSSEQEYAPIAQSIDQARKAIKLLSRHANSAEVEEESDSGCDIKFTIGFLDTIRVGAILTDADGTMVGFNRSMAGMLGGEHPDGDVSNILDLFSQNNDPAVRECIDSYLNNALDPDNPVNLEVRAAMPDGNLYDLTVVRFACEEEDRSACIVASPVEIDRQPDETAFSMRQTASLMRYFHLATSTMQKDLEESTKSKSGRPSAMARKLAPLSLRLQEIVALTDDISHTMQSDSNDERTQQIDLGSLLHSTLLKVSSENPECRLKCIHDDLPIIDAPREKLSWILEQLLAGLIECCSKADIGTSAEVNSEAITISFSGEISGLTASELQTAVECGLDNSAATGAGTGKVRLAMAGCAARQLGGWIEVESVSSPKVAIRLRLPLSTC